MRKDILQSLQKEIYDRCQRETNRFGLGCYYHIAAVVKNAELLAEKYGADKEIAWKNYALPMPTQFPTLIVSPVYCIWFTFKKEWGLKKGRNL